MPQAGQLVQVLDSNGEVVDFTGNITTLSGITVSSSVLPTGAATQVTLAALNTAIGTKADAAWSGTGDGTVIALLKAIALNTTPAA